LSLPLILDKYTPSIEGLPMYLLRLATEVGNPQHLAFSSSVFLLTLSLSLSTLYGNCLPMTGFGLSGFI